MRKITFLLLPLILMACIPNQEGSTGLRDSMPRPAIARGTVVTESDELAKMAVRLFDGENPHVSCTGVLLSPRAILSAKHCFVNKALEEKGYWLSIAEFKFTDNPLKKTIAIHEWRVHPSADLALILLQEDAPNDYRPAVLRSIQEFSNEPLVVLGFGRQAPGAPVDGALRSGFINGSSLISNESSIEASIDEPESAVCPGDSGGPAYMRENGTYFLVGIAVRADFDCAAYAFFVRPERFVGELLSASNERSSPTPASNFSSQIQDAENRRLKKLIELNARNFEVTGKGIRIAVIDTGISPVIAESFSNIEPGYNTVDPITTAYDQDGHGTAVAGIILQLSPQARILPVKVSIDGVSSRQAVVNGIVYAIQRKSKIINASLSLSEPLLREVRQEVGDAAFRQALIIISAGNDGHHVEPFDEEWSNVIMVGASNLDDPPMVASYSATGPGVDIFAPAGSAGDGLSTFCTNDIHCRRQFNGTSAAAPVVSAIAALVAEAHPTAQISEIKQLILSEARSIKSHKGQVNDGRFLNARGAIAPSIRGREASKMKMKMKMKMMPRPCIERKVM